MAVNAINGNIGTESLFKLNNSTGAGSLLKGTSASGDGNDFSTGFAGILQDAVSKVNDLQLDAEKTANDFALGKTDNIHEVMIASEKADIALQFAMQIRNKILDAYNEIMRMQV